MIRILTSSFRLVSFKAVFLIYTVLLLLALMIALPFYFTAAGQTGHSMEPDKLIPGFDFGIFTDFIRQSGKSFRPFFLFSAIMSLVTMIAQVFFSGGLISGFQKITGKFSINQFLRDSATMFQRYAGLLFLQLAYLLLSLLIFVVLLFVFLSFSSDGTEVTYFSLAAVPVLFLILTASFLMTSGDYAKNLVFRYNDLNPVQAMHRSFSYVIRNLKTIFIFWILLGGLFLCLLGYLLLEDLTGMTSPLTIFIFLFVQQCFIIIRIFFKTWSLAAAFGFLNDHPAFIPQKTELPEQLPE